MHLLTSFTLSLVLNVNNVKVGIASAVYQWSLKKKRDEDFYRKGIELLLKRWAKCVELMGDFVEK